MNEQEREMDLALAECEQENRLLRARNDRLNIEVQLLTEALRAKAWVGLTDEEKAQIYHEQKFVLGFYTPSKFADSIEAKLKEKNGG